MKIFDKKQNNTTVRIICHDITENRCYARVSSGRQCTNSTHKFKQSFCSIHKKRMPYGDIRKEPPEVVVPKSIQQKMKSLAKNMKIIETLPDIIRFNGTCFTHKNLCLNLTKNNTLKVIKSV